MSPLDFVAVDVETTGLNEKENEIIEIGMVKYRNGICIDEYSQILKPQKRISRYVVSMTGITNQMVEEAPRFKDVVGEILDFIGDELLIGHNIPFDLGMINSSLKRINYPVLKNRTIDTLDIVTLLLPMNRSYKLSHLAKKYGVMEANVHRAKDDAVMTSSLYLKLIDHLQHLDHDMINFIYYYIAPTKWELKDVLKSMHPESIKDEEMPWILIMLKEHEQSSIKKQKLSLNAEQKRSLSKLDIDSLFKFFKPGEVIEQRMNGYELRSSQLEMLEYVWQAFHDHEHVAIEAGTGIGKTFAYLLPSIFYALKTGEKVVISTKTKNLQEQLIDKDIPFLSSIIDYPFRSVMIKGRENYVCMNKIAYFINNVIRDQRVDDLKGMLSIMMWVFQSETGDFSEVHNSLVTRYKSQIYSDSYSCLQARCPFKSVCFINRLKKVADQAHVLVVNHALLLTDTYYGRTLLPEYNTLVVDEAHTLEDVATNCFSRGIGKKRIHDIGIILSEQRLWNELEIDDDAVKTLFSKCVAEGRALIGLNQKTFDLIERIFKRKEKENVFFKKTNKKINMDSLTEKDHGKLDAYTASLYEMLSDIENLLKQLNDVLKKGLNKIQYAFYRRTYLDVIHIREDVAYLKEEKKNYVRWLEKVEMGRSRFYDYKVVPIEAGKSLQDYVFSQMSSVVLTSATLSVKDSFDYFLSRMGYLETDIPIRTAQLSSPFDLENRMLLCVPQDTPAYQDDQQYLLQLADYLKRILLMTEGRALILFTSHKHLLEIYYHLRDFCQEHQIPLLCQGKKMSERNLIKTFRENTKSVLMGTDSFWEGIDVPGESLSHVIIVKLPFEVPTDPIVMARMERVANQGKSSFFEYSVPNAVVRLKQGVGRLIRQKSDKGSVMILDHRVLTHGYGRKFIDSIVAYKLFPRNIEELESIIDNWF